MSGPSIPTPKRPRGLAARATRALCAAMLCAMSGCMVGPDPPPPEARVSDTYRHGGTQRTSPPLPGDWWRVFGDRSLDKLVAEGTAASPTLDAALARVDRAAAEAGVARSELFPEIDFFASGLREKINGDSDASSGQRSRYRGGLGLDWEIDVWGRIRRLDRAARAEAEARATAYASSVVLLQASIARSYFAVRTLDERIRVLALAIDTRKEQRDIIETRASSGLASQLELARAETEWNVARAGMETLRRQRAVAESALAVLCGRDPSAFRLGSVGRWDAPTGVKLPSGVPSEMLRRRADLAEAEHLAAAAAQRVGARIAEFFPEFRLTAQGGIGASNIDDWLDASGFFGLVEPAITLPVFNFGRTERRVEAARAEYRELVAAYGAQVLEALREVENALASIGHLRREIGIQKEAVASADRAAALAKQRYTSGLVNFLEVVDAERVSLDAALRLAEIEGELLAATVSLAEALGGGWK